MTINTYANNKGKTIVKTYKQNIKENIQTTVRLAERGYYLVNHEIKDDDVITS